MWAFTCTRWRDLGGGILDWMDVSNRSISTCGPEVGQEAHNPVEAGGCMARGLSRSVTVRLACLVIGWAE